MTNKVAEELKFRFEKQLEIKASLEDKAKNTISTAGIITSLVFGFVTFSTSVFGFRFPVLLSIIIVASIIFSIVSILVSIWSLRVQDYRFYWNLKNIRNIKEDLKKAKDTDLPADYIDEYIENLIANKAQNIIKANQVQKGIWLLLTSVVLIGCATGSTLFYIYTQPTLSTFTIPNDAYIEGKQSYEPNPIRIREDRTISVENKDIRIHTVTDGEGPHDLNKGKRFDTGVIKPGESMEVTTKYKLDPGKYPFFCTIFPHMTGTIIVLDKSGLDLQRLYR